MSKSYDKMKSVYDQYAGTKIKTEHYEAVISGFHFAWNDMDSEYLIAAVLKEITANGRGLTYVKNGDVFVTHKGDPFQLIHITDVKRMSHVPIWKKLLRFINPFPTN